MLRGGSWNNNQNNARAAYRNNNNPGNRNNNIGFRVAVRRPTSLCGFFLRVSGLSGLHCRLLDRKPSSYPTIDYCFQFMPIDYGLWDAVRKGLRWRRFVPSVYGVGSIGALLVAGIYKNLGMAWIRSRHARPILIDDFRLWLSDHVSVCFIQPPSSRPISATIRLTCSYCPTESHCH